MDAYLSPERVADREAGCVLPTLGRASKRGEAATESTDRVRVMGFQAQWRTS